MSLPVTHERMTDRRCKSPVRDLTRRSGDRPCGYPLTELRVRIPAEIVVIVCPRCDVP